MVLDDPFWKGYSTPRWVVTHRWEPLPYGEVREVVQELCTANAVSGTGEKHNQSLIPPPTSTSKENLRASTKIQVHHAMVLTAPYQEKS